MKRNLKSFNVLVIGLYVFANTLFANPALETKCGTTEKNALITNLQQQRSTLQSTQPQKAQQVDKCMQSIYGAYAACVNTLNSAGAAALGAGKTSQMGQLQQFQSQQNAADGVSQLSMQDKALNDTCVQQYSGAQKTCTGFPAASSAQKYASKVRGMCAMDGQQAAANADSFEQVEEAAQELTPQMPQQSPTASPSNNTPSSQANSSSSMPGDGYSEPGDFAKTSPEFSFPNTLMNPAASPALALDSSSNEKANADKIQPSVGINDKSLFTADNEKIDNFLNDKNSNGAGPSSPVSTSGLLASGSSNDGSKSGEASNSIGDSNDAEENSFAGNSGSSGGGLAFAPGLSNPLDINSAPGLQKLMERAENPNTPVVEKIVPPNALPSKAKYGAKAPWQNAQKNSGSLSSLFRTKKVFNERRAPGSIETEQKPDNESEGMSRSMALLLLLALTAGAGQLYKKFLNA